MLALAINAEITLKLQEKARAHVELGKKLFPDNLYFQVKDAQLSAAEGNYTKAYEILNQLVDEYMGDSTVINAYAECCEVLARQEMKRNRYERALLLIDKGLKADPENQPLILAKSEVYEKLKDWDNAIATYRLYRPTFNEMTEYHLRMERLRRHMLRNEVTAGYQRARPSSEDNITSQASVSYSRQYTDNTYTVGLVYVGRDGLTSKTDSTDAEGGSGLQLSGEWQHRWDERLTYSVSAAVATKFMPRIKLGVGGTYSFDNDWTGTANLSYRLFNDDYKASLFDLGAGATKDLMPFVLGANAHVFFMTGKAAKSFTSNFFINGGLTARCYPVNDNRSYFFVAGSLGNAPELSLIDNAMPMRFDQLNTMLGAGGLIVFNSMIDFGVSGTWYNMSVSSTKNDKSRSRNYLYLDAHVTVHF